jgi:hypothetical protein
MRVEDYTGLPVGTKLEKGEIKVCPECGARGLAETSGNKEFFTHSQTTGLDGKGNPVVNWVMHERLLDPKKP